MSKEIKYGVAALEELKANLDAAHTCKWKALAGELVKVMQLTFDEWPEKITPCHREMQAALAKAREAGL